MQATSIKILKKLVYSQTDAPLKRAIIPNGGIRMVEGSCKAYDRTLDPQVKKIYTEYRKTHNAGVFDIYTPDILNCRKSGVLTGLPDAYGRGRIIGDYRRIALYGIDFLIERQICPVYLSARKIRKRRRSAYDNATP
ncbi:pyruvate formate lyase family protein [Vibrio sp. PP-XX7]